MLHWKFMTGGAVRSSPAVANDGTIYVGSDDGRLYALQSNGILNWKFPTLGAVSSSPAIDANGTVYVGSGDGSPYAINPDGTLKWKYFVGGGPVYSSPAVRRQRNDHLHRLEQWLATCAEPHRQGDLELLRLSWGRHRGIAGNLLQRDDLFRRADSRLLRAKSEWHGEMEIQPLASPGMLVPGRWRQRLDLRRTADISTLC
jgi:hypothetical protein